MNLPLLTKIPLSDCDRSESQIAKQYRLARRDGHLVLQGGFEWFALYRGALVESGITWRDIPIADVD